MNSSTIKNIPLLIVRLLIPFWPFLVAHLVVALILAINVSLRPYLIKILINKANSATPAIALKTLGPLALLYLLSMLAVYISYRLYNTLLIRTVPYFKKHIGVSLVKHMMGHSFEYYQLYFAGNLATKVADCIGGIPKAIKDFIEDFFINFLAAIIAIYTVWQVDLKFALGLIIWLIIFLSVSITFSLGTKTITRKSSEARSLVMGDIVDILSNIMTVRLFNGKNFEEARLGNTFNHYITTEQKRDRIFANISSFQGISFIIFQAVCLWWLIEGIKAKTITTGDFALILTINTSLVELLWSISKNVRAFAENTSNITQAISIIMAPNKIRDIPDAKELKITKGTIVFQDVHFSYSGTSPFFTDKSLTISAGQKVGLVGYSGSGKSTFVNLILRLFDVNSGTILIDDQDISKVTQESLRRSIAMIPQNPSLFHRSLKENISYGKKDASLAEIIEAAKKAYAHEFIMQLPEQYETQVGEGGGKLSGGQRQRITIARAILKNAPILMFDEATSQLDSITELQIQESLWNLMQGKTTLIIAHRLSTLLHMDRILVFDQGKIVEDGTHSKLLMQNGLYKSLWDAQIGGWLPEQKD